MTDTHPLVEAVFEAMNGELSEPCPCPDTCKTCRNAARAAIKTVLEYEPSRSEWLDLPRDLIMWRDFQQPTGASLYKHLKAAGTPIPQWLVDEIPDIDHVPPKGTVAVCVHRAINAAILREIEGE